MYGDVPLRGVFRTTINRSYKKGVRFTPFFAESKFLHINKN